MSELELMESIKYVDENVCQQLELKIRSLEYNYKQHFQYIQEMKPVNALLTKAQSSINSSSQRVTGTKQESTLEQLKRVYDLLSRTDSLTENMKGLLNSRDIRELIALLNTYEKIKQLKEETISYVGDIDQIPAVQTSFKQLQSILHFLIDRVLDLFIADIKRTTEVGICTQFPPNFSALTEVLSELKHIGPAMTLARTYNPIKQKTVISSVVSQFKCFFS